MNLLKAIDVRHSHRKYIDKPIQKDVVEKLQASIKKFNLEANLNMQLILNNSEAFNNLSKSYGMFTGVKNYIAMIGKASSLTKEKIGYYGEKLVLESTQLGIGTCWVGNSFDKKNCPCKVKEDEEFYCVIAFGYVADGFSIKEKIISKLMHRNTKSLNEMYELVGEAPSWFMNGMKAVQKSPSALNAQPAKFFYNNEKVIVKVKEHSKDAINMGIAKLHFEIGADGGNWQWSNDAEFTKQ